MLPFLLWYMVITLLGIGVYPVISSLVPQLPDRGYIFARTFGLLGWGYLYWLFGVLGITDNSPSGLVFTLLVICSASVYVVLRRGWDWFLRQWKEQRILIITVELLFLFSFSAWTYIRSLNPGIVGTEKPMELAFINAILRSDTFPPHDPWLAGYAISYYYFGYVMVAMLAKITATPGGVAFNLGVSAVFALSAVGSYGVVYYLVEFSNLKRKISSARGALLGPLFTLIVSNWEGFLHWLHSLGLFWHRDPSGRSVSNFWRWLDIRDLVSPPTGDSFGHWWWWRASRVIQDLNFQGKGKEVISEFPFFSYLLGDLHPHVLAMPFTFLVMAMGLAVFTGRGKDGIRWMGLFHLRMSLRDFLMAAFAVGGLSFLNTWDFPMYVALLSGAYTLRDLLDRDDWHLGLILKDFLSFGVAVGVTGLLFFLPFLISFDSQAGGLIPNVLYITPGSQLWVMFGPLLVPLFAFLTYLWRKKGGGVNLRHGLWFMVFTILALLLLSFALVTLVPLIPPLKGIGSVREVFLNSLDAPGLREAIQEGLWRRVAMPGTTLTLGLMGVLSFSLLWKAKTGDGQIHQGAKAVPAYPFALLLVIGGMSLVLIPEYVYLRDLFGYRINTIFKFYYQAWMMWSVVAAFGTLVLLNRLQRPGRFLVAGLLVLSVGLATVYPALGLWSRTNGFTPLRGKTLDGAAHFREFSPDEAAAAAWLKGASFGVIAESVGGSYSAHARMATYSGLPTILGWDFHEIQWRGGSELVNPRKQDVRTLYCTSEWAEARAILDRYDVRYVVVGQLEYATYVQNPETCPDGLQEEKFSEHMRVVYQQGEVTIYTP